ncbi:MAG: hypothetical protein IJR88_00355 [Clostridia bacterium]|nr:hypothetical protein [Clostridia bacterium]
MLKALLKKQFRELGQSLFPTRKKDKNGNIRTRSRAFYVLIYSLVFFSLTLTFLGLAFGLSSFLDPAIGLYSLYFSIVGLVAILFGVFGSVFSTYSSLYLAKDNDTLLSLPIPPAAILFVRMLTVFVMSAFYTLPVWIPGMVVFAIFAKTSLVTILSQLATYLLVCIFVCFLSALLGFFVAAIASRLKNKSIAAAILVVLFLGVYYFACFRMGNIMTALIENAAKIGAFADKYLLFLVWLGEGACGQGLSLLLFALVVLALFALLYFILSKTFIAITTRKVGEKKAIYHETTARKGSVSSALLKKEWKRFVGSTTYLLNAGLGVLLVPIFTVVLAVKSKDLLPALASMGLASATAVLPYLVPALFLSMNAIAAPSISLEGKTLWMLKTLPVTPWQVLRAKLSLHMLVNAPMGVVATIFLGVWFGLDVLSILLAVLALVAVLFLSALWCLFWGVKKPMLDWTNEAYPIKQSAPVMFAVFGGMGLAVVSGIPGFLLCSVLHPAAYYAILVVVLLVPSFFLFRWAKTGGAKLLEEL